MQSLVVPKNRKPKFNLTFSIIDLNNIPYISGRIYVKWSLPSSASGVASSSTASSNHTDKVPIRDHRAELDCTVTAPIRMLVDKRNVLQDALLEFEVWHDLHGGHGAHLVGKDEKTKIGIVRVNLAEYVKETSGEETQGVTRRHLLYESKVNCTLKVTVDMKQIEGDDKFDAPALRQDPGFSGITGLMRDTNDEADDLTSLSHNARTNASTPQPDDLNEVYRQTLAAELLREPGQPSAEEVIEDIFAGGDGWTKYKQMQAQHAPSSSGGGDHEGGSDGEVNSKGSIRPNKRSWPDFGTGPGQLGHAGVSSLTGRRLFPDYSSSRSDGQHHSHLHVLPSGGQIRRNNSRGSFGKSEDPFRVVKSRGSFARSHEGDLDSQWVGQVPEVNEFDVRDDLKCWNSFE